MPRISCVATVPRQHSYRGCEIRSSVNRKRRRSIAPPVNSALLVAVPPTITIGVVLSDIALTLFGAGPGGQFLRNPMRLVETLAPAAVALTIGIVVIQALAHVGYPLVQG